MGTHIQSILIPRHSIPRWHSGQYGQCRIRSQRDSRCAVWGIIIFHCYEYKSTPEWLRTSQWRIVLCRSSRHFRSVPRTSMSDGKGVATERWMLKGREIVQIIPRENIETTATESIEAVRLKVGEAEPRAELQYLPQYGLWRRSYWNPQTVDSKARKKIKEKKKRSWYFYYHITPFTHLRDPKPETRRSSYPWREKKKKYNRMNYLVPSWFLFFPSSMSNRRDPSAPSFQTR